MGAALYPFYRFICDGLWLSYISINFLIVSFLGILITYYVAWEIINAARKYLLK